MLSIEVLRQKHLIKTTIQRAYKAANYPESFPCIRQCFDDRDKQEISAYLSLLYENNNLRETEKSNLAKAQVGQEYFKKKSCINTALNVQYAVLTVNRC